MEFNKTQGYKTISIKSYICSGFSLFTEVMFYKVIVNNELVNTEPLLLGEIQGDFPTNPLSQHFH